MKFITEAGRPGALAVIRSVALISLALLAVPGCQHTQTLMPTPVAFQGKNADPFAQVAASERKTEYEVFLFTDRKPSGKSEPDSFYSNDRSLEGRLAIATVQVGANMDWQELHEASLQEKRHTDPTLELVRVEEIGSLWTSVSKSPARFERTPTADAEAKVPAQRFAAALNAKLANSRQKDVFVFVHGFNTKFHENVELAAELHHYLGREGAFVSYAWPSRDSLLSYSADKANAAYSTRMFRLLLTHLATETHARRIHLLGHSAGSPIVVDALRQLRLMNYERDADSVRARYRIGQVVLAAPDMDLMQFFNAWNDGCYEIADRMTVYASTKDHALALSSFLYHDTRLGEPLESIGRDALESLSQIADFELVSVTAAEKAHGSWLGHSYFHEDPWVSSDLLLLLRSGVSAKDRGLMRGEEDAVWEFPADYGERVRAIAARPDSTDP